MNASNESKLSGIIGGLLAAATVLSFPAASNAGPADAPLTASTYIVLDNPGDLNFNQLLGISNGGVIVGYFGDSVVVPNNGYVLVPQNHYSPENFTNLLKGDSATQTQAIGIDNSDLASIVGFYTDKTTGFTHGFVDEAGSQITIDDPNGVSPKIKNPVQNLLGISGANTAGGFWLDNAGHEHGFVVVIDMANPAMSKFTEINKKFKGSTGSQASNVTDNNDICGFWTDSAGNNHGFYGPLSSFASIEVVIGGVAAVSTSPFGCNNNGEVVGSFVDSGGNTHGFVYEGGAYTQYDAPGSSQTAAFGVSGTFINGVNDAGSFVGFFSDGVKVHGFAQLASP